MNLAKIGVSGDSDSFHGVCDVEVPMKMHGIVGNQCSIGAYTYIQEGTTLDVANVGRFCSIAAQVSIGAGEHPVDWLSTHPFICDPADYSTGLSTIDPSFKEWFGSTPSRQNTFARGPVTIGNDVWIGLRAIIRQGVTIGDGAIIGAGSIVTSNVAPYAIVAGAPARHIRYRLEPDIIARLLQLRWWAYDLSRLTSRIDYSNVPSAVDMIENAVDRGLLGLLSPQRYSVSRNGIKRIS